MTLQYPGSPARVCIVGGGFSGAVVAVHLARKARAPMEIAIVEPRGALGGGVAYSATDPAHRINVPAAKMTVFADDPTQFDRWAKGAGVLESDPAALWVNGAVFPQRAVFGSYIAGLVAAAAAENPAVRITHHRSLATGITPADGGYAVTLADGGTLAAGVVVLAVSHPPPAVPRQLQAVEALGASIVTHPWAAGALDGIPPDANILIVGTGLTMADVVASLDRRAHRGPILAISRRGLLSRGHLPVDLPTWSHFDTAPPPRTAAALCGAIRTQIRLARQRDIPWQSVFDDVRAQAPRLWPALSAAEQRRVVRHLRPFWDVHRFRVSPQAEAAIARLRTDGQLKIMAASLLGATFDAGLLAVGLKPRRAAAMTYGADAIVLTTGPAHSAAVDNNPALASLSSQGLLRPDPAGLGLDTDAQNQAIGVSGRPSHGLLVAGPLARGRVGELMGLPQVSLHAETVAGIATGFFT